MSSMHLAVGTMAAIATLQFGISAVLPDPKPIQVHKLAYEAGVMVQDRTVTTGGDFFWAQWEAQILDAKTGDVVCEGGGSWHYESGRIAARMSIPKWVGDPDCVLDAGTPYIPRAAWFWGDDQEVHTGEPFTAI